MSDFYNDLEKIEEDYPWFFYKWDELLSADQIPCFLDTDEFSEIIEIYLIEEEFTKAKKTIYYALAYHSNNEDLIYDIILLLDDFKQWNDLLVLTEQYKNIQSVWIDEYRLISLLHLGMEEDTFVYFKKMKYKYKKDIENLSDIYITMSKNLIEIDLFNSAVDVINEGITILGPTIDFYRLLLQSYLLLKQKEKALEIINEIKQIDTSNGKTWHCLGKAYFSIDETSKAIEAFEFAESLGYCKQANYLNLIVAYQSSGYFMKALTKAKEYLQLFPNHYIINILAVIICSCIGKWEEGLFYVNAALEEVPKMNFLYLYKSYFFLNLGKEKKAISVLKEGIEQTKDVQGDLKKELEKLRNQYPDY